MDRPRHRIFDAGVESGWQLLEYSKCTEKWRKSTHLIVINYDDQGRVHNATLGKADRGWFFRGDHIPARIVAAMRAESNKRTVCLAKEAQELIQQWATASR